MKITNWRRKLLAACAAGGLVVPCVTHAAPTNTNLVVNPGYENVDLATTSFYNAPLILDWTGAVNGFAYSHDLSGAGVPDFANGGPLAGGGHWYFTPGNGGNQSFADALKQDIDVSSGPSAAAIATGAAPFNLSAFFSTYSAQLDRGFVQADFLGPLDGILGSAQVASLVPPPLATWTQFETSGVVPIGTLKVRLSSWGEIGQPGSADGYTDNVSFIIAPEPTSIVLVGLACGAIALGLPRRRCTS